MESYSKHMYYAYYFWKSLHQHKKEFTHFDYTNDFHTDNTNIFTYYGCHKSVFELIISWNSNNTFHNSQYINAIAAMEYFDRLLKKHISMNIDSVDYVTNITMIFIDHRK